MSWRLSCVAAVLRRLHVDVSGTEWTSRDHGLEGRIRSTTGRADSTLSAVHRQLALPRQTALCLVGRSSPKPRMVPTIRDFGLTSGHGLAEAEAQ